MGATPDNVLTVITESGVEQQTAETLKAAFMLYFERAKEWEAKARSIKVTDASQVDMMSDAREARLALKNIRVSADKTRKELKEDSIRYGRAVQGIYNVIEFLIVPIEKYLDDQERFAIKQEEEKRRKLLEARTAEALPYAEYLPVGIALGELSEADYAGMLEYAKSRRAAVEKQAQELAEQEVARKRKEEEDRERIRKENERLRMEVEKKQAAIEEERRAAAERLAKERQKKQEAEQELALKKRDEIRAEQERQRAAEAERRKAEEERRAAELAPDKEKILRFVNDIAGVPVPSVVSNQAKEIVAQINTLVVKIQDFARGKVLNLK